MFLSVVVFNTKGEPMKEFFAGKGSTFLLDTSLFYSKILW